MGNKQTTIQRNEELKAQLEGCVTAEGNISYEKLAELKEQWNEAECNIAIIGASGTGKSTLINNLLGASIVKDKAELAKIAKQIAECDHINRETCSHNYALTGSRETTKKATPYAFPDNKKVRLWDLPGFGREFYPSVETYWKQLEIGRYDAFLCLFKDNRVAEEDIKVVDFLLQLGKPIVWVRTFFDGASRDMDEAEQKEEKKISCDYLRRLGVFYPEVYCVSGMYIPHVPRTYIHLYDLDDLKAAVMKKIPIAQQILLAQLFQGFSEELVQAKFNALQVDINITLIGSSTTVAVSSFVPVVGPLWSRNLNNQQVQQFIKKATAVYGFTDPTLLNEYAERIADELRHQQDTQITNNATLILEIAAGIIFSGPISAALSTVLSGSVIADDLHKINHIYYDAAMKAVKNLKQTDG